ncbi:MAG: hypothetical protein IKW13_06800, partial [Thermoguttaceae bacterium]|nr:hypothetical protein [Thermoguttaceae bacterium]
GEEAQISEESQVGEEAQTGEESQVGEEAQIGGESQVGEEAQIGGESQVGEEAQISEESQIGEEAQIGGENQVGEEAQIGEESQVGEEAQISEENQVGEEAQISGESQVGEEARISGENQVGEEAQISEESQVGEEAQISEENQVGQGQLAAQAEENAPFIQPAPTTRASRRFRFIPKFIAPSRNAQRSPFIAKRARRLDEIAASPPVRFAEIVETPVPRVSPAPNVDAERAVVPQEIAPPSCAPTAHPPAERPPFDPTTLPPEERRLAELLGRRPSKIELDEYYWEPISETSQVEYESERRASFLDAALSLATAPVIAVGRATLSLCAGAGRRTALGSDAFAATKSRRRQSSKFSDMMISTVSGVLIAVVVVFPLMRLAVKEVFTTIAKSAVRKIGVHVPVSENAPQSDLLPFISEQLMFPRYETANPQGVGGGETPWEPGTRFETFAPPSVDPASTPPTLEPESSNDDATFALPKNAQE